MRFPHFRTQNPQFLTSQHRGMLRGIKLCVMQHVDRLKRTADAFDVFGESVSGRRMPGSDFADLCFFVRYWLSQSQHYPLDCFSACKSVSTHTLTKTADLNGDSLNRGGIENWSICFVSIERQLHNYHCTWRSLLCQS